MTDKDFNLFDTNLDKENDTDIFDSFVSNTESKEIEEENVKKSRPIPVPDLNEITELTNEINSDKPETKIERFNRLLEELKELKKEIEQDKLIAEKLLKNKQNIDEDSYE